MTRDLKSVERKNKKTNRTHSSVLAAVHSICADELGEYQIAKRGFSMLSKEKKLYVWVWLTPCTRIANGRFMITRNLFRFVFFFSFAFTKSILNGNLMCT